ncbi:MAG TPA: sensor histidine kinase, partial [Methanocella sp.]|nr:sensor histidine kinase [Methanocella sp.]
VHTNNKQPLIGTITRDVTDQKMAESALRESLNEKDMLLREIHHRVKNNLQVISSMISLQIDASTDDAIGNVLEVCRDRIKSMALIHERLYLTDNFTRINFGDYVRKLASYLSHYHKDKAENISLTIDADDILLGIDTAIPCGLIVNELLTNSMKYAFPDDRKGEILVRLTTGENGHHRLIVADNGVGMPPEIDITKTQTLGLQLVTLLADQLEGAVSIDSKGGAKFTITFRSR